MAELSPDARALLAAAAGADDPTPEQRARADAAARIALALHGATDLPPLEPPHAAVTANAAQSGATAKLGAAASSWKLAAGAALLIAAGLLGMRALDSDPLPPRAASAPARATSVHPRSQASPAVTGDERERSAPAQAGAAEHSRVAPSQVATSQVAGSRPARSESVASAAGAHTVERVVSTAQPAPTLQAEVALIAAANTLIRGQRFAEAERVLATHERRFAHGTLREERAALVVLVRCATGPRERGLRAMQHFLRTSPQSVLARRVRAACAAEREP